MIGLAQTKRTLKWFEEYLKEKDKGFLIEKNKEEKSYILYFQNYNIFKTDKGYERTNIAKFYRDKEDIEIYSYNGKDFDLFVKGLSMLKYWIDSADLEERFADEIKSAYKHKDFITEFGEGKYLNIASFTNPKEQYPCLTTIGDRFDYLQKYFTDEEINKYKREFGIDLSEYEKIREGVYAN